MLDESAVKELESAAARPGEKNAPTSGFTTIGCGGPAAFIIEADSSERLAAILAVASRHEIPWFAIGRGSNLLVADSGWDGLMVRLAGDLRLCSRRGDRINCGAAALLPQVIMFAAGEGLSGMEPLGSIPGTLGGAVAMNAGAFGTAIGDLVETVEVCIPGETRTLDAASISFGYRQSSLPAGSVVTRATLVLKPGDPEAITDSIMSFRQKRNERQPRGQTFGSVFKNPGGDNAAGSLLEQAGCKGMASGAAAVSEVHANFIINRGGASAADVLDLMNQCRRRVYDRFKVVFEPEVRLIGDLKLSPLP